MQSIQCSDRPLCKESKPFVRPAQIRRFFEEQYSERLQLLEIEMLDKLMINPEGKFKLYKEDNYYED